MGSDETAITIPGGPRVIDVFHATGRHRAQIIYFFRMQIGSRTPSGIGLGSDGRLRRMRPLGAPQRALDRKLGGVWLWPDVWLRELAICIYRWKLPRLRCRGLRTSNSIQKRPQGDLRTTNRQDSIDAAALVGSSISRIKKINFFGPQEVSH